MSDMRLTREGAIEVSASMPVHHAEELTLGGNQARIILGDQIYSLRITRSGKLILTK